MDTLAKEQADRKPAEPDGVLFRRRLTLTRRPSESFSDTPLSGLNEDAVEMEDSVTEFPTVSTPFKPGQSLSERTMETLANIPSSPAVSRKPSAFFERNRSRSRAGSTASRPGSSYNSDGSNRPPSAASRPGSRLGYQQEPNFRGSTSTYHAPLSTLDGTPRARSSGLQTPKTPVLRKTTSRASLGSTSKLPQTGATTTTNSTPTTARKNYGMLPPKTGAKTVASRPLKPKPSAGSLYRKPSLPAIDLGAANSKVSPDESEKASSARKSSAALRDQIAKAKAAKREAMRQSISAQALEAQTEEPIVPSDDGFDFGVAHEDPFNLKKGETASQRVLQQRIGAARSTGRLNIAALSLKEIPVEVMKMYDLESVGASGGNWAESVDLTRFVAADNEFEKLDDFIFPDSDPSSFASEEDSAGSMFGGLETMDLHGNLLVNVPLGFRRLANLTSLNLSSNRLQNNCLDTIAQMTSLRDLKLAKNLFYGPLAPELSNLTSLEILDMHGNNVSALPRGLEKMTRLRILNLSENSIESLSFSQLAQLPLTELLLRKNKLAGTLIEDPVDRLPQLQTLDASVNQLTRLVPLGAAIDLPVLHALSLSANRLQGLPDMTTWTNLLTLTVDENSISGIPNSFTTLEKLRHADFSGNDIRVVPPEIARMDNLTMIRLSGNPLRDKKFVSLATDELKDALAARLEPPPPYPHQEADSDVPPGVPGFLADAKAEMRAQERLEQRDARYGDEDEDSLDDNFATPPTSAPHSPARSRSQTVSSLRSRSRTLSKEVWPVKSGGVLDRSRTDSSSLQPVVCSKVAAEHRIKQVMLHYNLFTSLPDSLSFFAETLSILSLSNNQFVGETYLAESIDFPALRELNLASNRITGLEPLVRHLNAPQLEKLDVCLNRVNGLPKTLTGAFPLLKVLLASNNQITDLEPETIKGLRIVDVSSNDISRLNPRLGLLGGSGGLEKLDVMGNRFKVPRWNVLERGTESTLRWLRGRVPLAEKAEWKGDDGDEASSDVE
ncbi:Leucine-rich repeat-containing protein-like protein [Emericellopsis cladophorae]|uniref:Leucine-rich repeat-containing protein-like protein n=1 Tax=Emericellopsis cladophorae TaxID=2686198 RepID=A0A9Q0BGJ6_9HYPO|nr:Leucine-rich repeat-containing protein-like protein [Emericellopsis cladophorae]KAI6784567.1 Leucine-rich repeat-containing protein-like protein [Emericellopsis cladophorae]